MHARALVLVIAIAPLSAAARADTEATEAPPSAVVPTAGPSRTALPLVWVVPTYPGKNNVRWWEFGWRFLDFRPTPGAAAVRLYFYEDERTVAGLAKAFTAEAYREYVEAFAYKPSRTIPYLVYNSHFEFESTNAFFVSEQVLGVTSTVDLTMALPYWGEHQRFKHVMRHELAHQFTIQLVRDATAKSDCDALIEYPLWFIEGLAQFFALGDIDAEVRGSLVDHLLERPESRRGGLPKLFDEGPLDFERVYLIGHAQTAFLEEVGGRGTVRRLLTDSPRLCGMREPTRGVKVDLDFVSLVTSTLKTTREALEERWRQWVLDRVAPQLVAHHPLAVLPKVQGFAGEMDGFALSPDQRTVFYRTVERNTGRVHLYLQDADDEESRAQVDRDQRPGMVSFHPGDRRVTAIGQDFIAYVGRVDATDVLFVRRYRRQAGKDGLTFVLGPPVAHALWEAHSLIELAFPAIHPRDGSVAFVGLDRRSGFLDVFRLDRPFEAGARATRLTDDPYAERELGFAPDGALLYTSDRTPDGEVQLFRLAGGESRQLTQLPRRSAIQDVTPTPEGVLFSAADGGVQQVIRYRDGTLTRLTDVPTAIGAPALDRTGALLALVREAGRPRLVRLPQDRWLAPPPATEPLAVAEPAAVVAPWRLPLGTPDSALDSPRDYSALSPRNYRPQALWLAAGTGPYLFLVASANDILRDHVVIATAEVLDEWERTNARLLFVDRSGRFGLGWDVFVRTGLQLTFEDPNAPGEYLLQRIGGAFVFEYPFGYFSRIEAFLSAQVVRPFDFTVPSRFARENPSFVPALQVGGRFALDTLRLVPWVGPVDGYSFMLAGEVTQRTKGRPFGTLQLAFDGYQALSPRDRVYLWGHVGAGTGYGGQWADQFYLPAIFNLRAFPEGALELVGKHYTIANAELRVPLDFMLPFLSYVEGVAGLDAGSVMFDWDHAWRSRVAAGVLGFNFGLGPLVLRLHFSRPIDVGGAPVLRDEWLTHFILTLPYITF